MSRLDPGMLKYLDRYAEPLARAVLPSGGPFETAVVVPAYGEEPAALDRLLDQGALAARAGLETNLLVLVVNEPEGAPATFREANQRLITAVKTRFPVHDVQGCLTLCAAASERATGGLEPSVLLVDVTGSPLPKKEGVGRARKIGLDLALRLYSDGTVRSAYAASTDCDVVLPSNYLAPLVEECASSRQGSPRSSGLLFPYRHFAATSKETARAMVEVEITFRQYVLGLAEAGSPYAYHSLGSALAVSLPHYAQVRGVPVRAAGEDFYLLSKLSQLAPLRRLSAPLLGIQTRLSDRVPFGTGPSLARAEERASEGSEPVLTHHPEAFRLLGLVIRRLSERTRSDCWQEDFAFFSREQKVPLWVQKWVDDFWEGLTPGLLACPSSVHRLRRLHERLDALRTLQFIHQAHREGLPRLPVDQALASLGVPTKEDLLRVLQEREEALPEWIGPSVLLHTDVAVDVQ